MTTNPTRASLLRVVSFASAFGDGVFPAGIPHPNRSGLRADAAACSSAVWLNVLLLPLARIGTIASRGRGDEAVVAALL